MTVYEGIPGPYSAFAAATGPAGIDDYASIESGPFRLAQFKFVGGVTSVGGPMTVEFLNSSSTVVNGFTAALPSAGDFIWNITLGAAPDGSDSTFVVPRDGFIRLTVGANTTGRWFLTTTPPTIGSNNFTVGTGSGLSPQRNNTFALVAVPSPGAGALLGLGGLFALRRRR
jgi:hypothetical protein